MPPGHKTQKAAKEKTSRNLGLSPVHAPGNLVLSPAALKEESGNLLVTEGSLPRLEKEFRVGQASIIRARDLLRENPGLAEALAKCALRAHLTDDQLAEEEPGSSWPWLTNR
jgi:hypothetical protein